MSRCKLVFYYVIILDMKGSPIRLKQKLSPKASAAKAARDKKSAMTAWGKYKKRTAQKRDVQLVKILIMPLVSVSLLV